MPNNSATGIGFFNQCNHHHTLTLGEHCTKVSNYILNHCPITNQTLLLHITALLHDVGKIFTQTNINSKGEKDGECHYYQHNCVGVYDSIFYIYNLGYYVDDIIHVSNIIYYHMCPYAEWKNEKLRDKMKAFLGEKLFDDIMILHEADKSAH